MFKFIKLISVILLAYSISFITGFFIGIITI